MVEPDAEMAWLHQALALLVARHGKRGAAAGGGTAYLGGLAQAGHADAQDAGGHRASGPGDGGLPKGVQADRLDETAQAVEQLKRQVGELDQRLKKLEGQQTAVVPVNKVVQAPDSRFPLRRWIRGLLGTGRG